MSFMLWKVTFAIGRLNYFSNEYFISGFFLLHIHLHMYFIPHVVDIGYQQFEIQLFPVLVFFLFFLHRAAVIKIFFFFFKYFLRFKVLT